MSLRKPLRIAPGRDALLTCVADHLGNHTLMWKKVLDADGEQTTELLTAGDYRVSNNSRIVVLHDSGKTGEGDVEGVVQRPESLF